jgi:iron complex outermembrane receptor protein
MPQATATPFLQLRMLQVGARGVGAAICIFGAGLAGSGATRAQGVPQQAPETLGEISAEGGDVAQRGYQPVRSGTATLSDKPIIDTPQSVAVVTSQVLRDQQVRTLDEALYNVSGVTQANTLGGTQDAFIRRGFGDNRDGSILRDGLRTALPRTFDATGIGTLRHS